MKSKWLMVLVWALWPAWLAAQSVVVNGDVREQRTNRAIPNLEVRLVPPRATSQAIRVARTDAQGRFSFAGAPRGTYLLEVSSGMNLLYRKEVNTTQNAPIRIQLARR